MKYIANGAVYLTILMALAGCGGYQVDESALPTRVPPLDANFFVVAALPPTPTTAPQPTPVPTVAPTAVAPAAAPTAAPPAASAAGSPNPYATATPTVAPPAPTETPSAPAEAEGAPAESEAAPAEPPAESAPAPSELPASIVAALAQADPMRGQQLTLSSGCIGCHALDPNQVMPGPTWHNVGNVAPTRVPDQSAELYLYNSIIHPNDYLVEGFQPNIMLQIYQDTLTEQNLADLIAYLLTLKSN